MKTIYKCSGLHHCFAMMLSSAFNVFFLSNEAFAQTSLSNPLDSMLQALEHQKDPVERAKSLNDISFNYLNLDPDKCLIYAQQALEVAESHQVEDQIARAYNNIGSYHANLSDFDKALVNYELSLKIYERLNNERWVANILGNIGYLYNIKGNNALSLDYQLRALGIFEKIGYKMGMANQSLGVGNIYSDQKIYEKAIQYDSSALKLYEEMGNQSGIALVLGNLANIFENTGETEKAKQHYLRSSELYEQIGDPSGMARNYSNLSTIYQAERNYPEALHLLQKAEKLFRENDYYTGIIYATGNTGICYYSSYKYHGRTDSTFLVVPGSKDFLLRQAAFHLGNAVEMAQASGELNVLSEFSKVLAEIFEEKKQFAEAFKYHKIYSEAKDSVQSLESKIMIEELTTEREVELKNKQIELDRLAVQLKRNERVYFIIGMGLLAVSLIFIYRNYANQKKSNVELASLNHRIADTNRELEGKNTQLSDTLHHLKETQEQLIVSEKLKENALTRSRISQDIHDDISSGLSKISWLAEAVIAKSMPHQAASVDVSLLEKINHFSRETVAKLGEIIWSSNPERDNLPSLLSYMRNHINQYMEGNHIRCRTKFQDDLPDYTINPELRRNLFLVMKEALHNAVKYSQANTITVSLQLDQDRYTLQVADDGIGMEEGVVKGSGNGLLNLRRRMAAVHGQMHIASAPDQGTTLTFTGEIY